MLRNWDALQHALGQPIERPVEIPHALLSHCRERDAITATAIVVDSGILAVYFLFVQKTTRLWMVVKPMSEGRWVLRR